MGAVIDSSVLIATERGKLDFNRELADYGDEPVAIATITASELLHGVHRAQLPKNSRPEGASLVSRACSVR